MRHRPMRDAPTRVPTMRITPLRAALFAALVLLIAGRGAALAGEACYEHQFLGDHPDEANPGWHQEAQGLTHNADNWYAVQNIEACVVHDGDPLCIVHNIPEGCVLPAVFCDMFGPPSSCDTRRPGVVWKIPVTHDLSDPPAIDIGTVSKDVCDAGVSHVGDPTHYVHKGSGFILAPLEGGGPRLAVWGDDLTAGMIAWGELDPAASGQSSSSWVAVDHEGLLWSGSHNETHLNRFQIDWDQLRDSGVLDLHFLDQVPLLDEAGQPLALESYEQGGDFSDSPALPFPLLYMVNGDDTNDCDCGIHVFEVRKADTGEACGSSPGPCVARRVDRSANGSGDFSYAYNPGFATYEEPEGITFWDLDADPRAPNVAGQVHVVLLDNDDPNAGQGDDDVYVKHYRLETDDVPPAIVCPAGVTVECTGDSGAQATDPQLAPFFAGVSASDVCDPQVAITNDAPAFYPLGMTLVTFTATDDFHNASSCTATVTVQDTIDPVITVALDRDVLWPPNHKLVTIGAVVTVTDVCDPNATFVLTSITSSEPDNGLGDGDTSGDIQGADFGSADDSVLLRSERSGKGGGRVYTLVFTASDTSDNTSHATATVQVPHDPSGQAKAAYGFSPNGGRFADGFQSFDLVIPSARGFDARLVDPNTVQVGNTSGVIDAVAGRLLDMNRDGLADLVVRYAVPPAAGVQQDSGNKNPLGMRYGTIEGTFYLVPDSFRLGPPVGGRTSSF